MSINVFQNQPKGSVIFTSSQNWVVPSGVHRIKILMVGGGGGGGGGYSTTYVGGGGGSGAILYADVLVVPGTNLQINVGGGGAGGTGGASPTAGQNGGQSSINPYGGGVSLQAAGGYGGGAATSSANGSGGGGGFVAGPLWGNWGQNFFVIDYYTAAGNAGSGQQQGQTPVLAPGFDGTNSVYGWGGLGASTAGNNSGPGEGGSGGSVNSNGTPGTQGIVVIWWGDD